MRAVFYVDWNMCGGDDLPPDFNLQKFCEVLQAKLSDVEVVPLTDPEDRAVNLVPVLVSDDVFHEALKEYCQGG